MFLLKLGDLGTLPPVKCANRTALRPACLGNPIRIGQVTLPVQKEPQICGLGAPKQRAES
jgi:hypothetical protein